ncbi:MAG TPA: CRTAC1 family protein [Chthonomonadaceae bacterium]|nr:CRTAC1 family protein [Chthonomonadaceae bacterium]
MLGLDLLEQVQVLLLQAGALPPDRKPPREAQNRLYHNNGDGTFTDVTIGSGLEDTGYSQGVAVGDYDGDGYDDVFITAYGGNHLFHNEHGSGKFKDVTARAGLADTAKGPRWCTSAAFGDYNNDGKLDLYVCRYAIWSFATDKPCKNPRGQSSYCSPELYAPEVHALYRNNGDGTFTDVSKEAGITKVRGHGLGVAWLDYDGDGWEDIFVANDLSPYMLWHNNGDGTFTNVAPNAGVAYSEMGSLLSGMGVGVRDFNGDGREDIFVTNFSGQMNALYRSEKSGLFTNVTTLSGVGPISMKRLAFGCEFIDYDRDGWPDLVIGNGHVNDDVEAYSQGDTYQQPKSLLHNNGDGTFTDVQESLGDLARPRVTRGLAVADYDLDGNLDILANNQDGPPELLHYTGPQRGHWFALDTRGTRSNPDGYHARVTVRVGKRTLFAEVRSGSSFGSHSHSRLYFGLGGAMRIDEVKIVWHGSHTVTVARNVPADRGYRVVEGQGLRLAIAARRKAGMP